MSRTMRTGMMVLALAASAGPVLAQIPGMPLFTNPRYGTGLRVHADLGMPQVDDPNGDLQVVQGGVTFALGPIGLGANLGMTRSNAENVSGCNTNPTEACLDQRVTASALAQLRVAGGGRSNLSLSLFGGASMDLSVDSMPGTSFSPAEVINIPVGVAIGLRVPLGMASLNLWGAPRYSFTRIKDCNAPCVQPDPVFGWAVGADLPLFRILSVRAAYDSFKPDGATESINTIGVGVSIGIGGMR